GTAALPPGGQPLIPRRRRQPAPPPKTTKAVPTGSSGGYGLISRCPGYAPEPRLPKSCDSAPAAGLEQLQALLQQLLELFLTAPLQQHVPMRARRLHLLGLLRGAFEEHTFLTVLAQPGGRDLGLVGERDIEFFTIVGPVPGDPAGSQIMVAVGFVAHRSEPAAPEYAICHLYRSSLCCRRVTARRSAGSRMFGPGSPDRKHLLAYPLRCT